MEPFDFYYKKIRSSFSQLQERRNEGKKEVSNEGTKERHEGMEGRRNVMKEWRDEGKSWRNGGTKERHEGTEKRRNVMKERRNEGTSQGREERKNTEETEEPEENMCK